MHFGGVEGITRKMSRIAYLIYEEEKNSCCSCFFFVVVCYALRLSLYKCMMFFLYCFQGELYSRTFKVVTVNSTFLCSQSLTHFLFIVPFTFSKFFFLFYNITNFIVLLLIYLVTFSFCLVV